MRPELMLTRDSSTALNARKLARSMMVHEDCVTIMNRTPEGGYLAFARYSVGKLVLEVEAHENDPLQAYAGALEHLLRHAVEIIVCGDPVLAGLWRI